MRIVKLLVFVLFISISLFGCTSTQDSIQMRLNAGIDTIGIDDDHHDSGAKAQYGFKIIAVEVIENTVDSAVLGVYRIVYYATYLDFEQTITRYVTVVDDIPPVITLIAGVDTLFLGTEWIDLGITTSDNSGDFVTVTVSGTVNHLVLGEYQIIYRATDPSGNQTIMYRYVNIISNE